MKNTNLAIITFLIRQLRNDGEIQGIIISVVRRLHLPCIPFSRQSFSLVFGGRSLHIPAQTQTVWFSIVPPHQWFTNFFSLAYPLAAYSINYTLHISSANRHNVQFISQLLTCILSYNVDVRALFRQYSIFFRVPLNVPVRTLWGTRTPDWDSVLQMNTGTLT